MRVLLIEDDLIEIMKFERTLNSHDPNHQLVSVKNGEEAIQILEQKNNLPDLIFLDLNMPKMNGLEFLKILRGHAEWCYLPTVILTTSVNQKDLKKAYELGVSGYLNKPLKFEDYVDRIEKALSYWSINELIKSN